MLKNKQSKKLIFWFYPETYTSELKQKCPLHDIIGDQHFVLDEEGRLITGFSDKTPNVLYWMCYYLFFSNHEGEVE